jgi:two-component system chemotaxis sensor kinase CheA
MKAFFQVVKVDPRVFGDFLEDCAYEFNRINEILKNKKIGSREALTRIYQCVHAIKSNALILGLDQFGESLHQLEEEIKKLEDHQTIEFKDLLHITIELENVMKENDKLRDMINNVKSFMGGQGERQDKYVLVETLKRAVKKACEAEGKKAQLDADNIDGAALENAPRRIIKEVLTQLVRNAVSHGLEGSAERQEKGKNAVGRISVSLKEELAAGKKTLHIKLGDDGAGLDFKAIYKRAAALHLLKDATYNKNSLLPLIFAPGFSTSRSVDAYSGRGMGLSLVRDRVRSLHGSIKLQTEVGKGTIFHIFIPVEA